MRILALTTMPVIILFSLLAILSIDDIKDKKILVFYSIILPLAIEVLIVAIFDKL